MTTQRHPHNALSEVDFVARYRELFEHSPWVVERAATQRPFDDLYVGLMAVVHAASLEDQERLICAHPELAGKAALDRTLTAASSAEQASAGLDRLSEVEYAQFHALNQTYRQHFGFPFVICVRQHDKAGILAELARRLQQPRSAERASAIEEIGKIVQLRLEAMR